MNDNAITTRDTTETAEEGPLLRVRNLSISFTGGRAGGLLGKRRVIPAVRDVTFDIYPGQTVGLVGESGSGKSTIGRAILQLVEPTEGAVTFRGQQITGLTGRALLPFRRQVQVVFQDPYSSLNPSKTVASIVGEALDAGGDVTRTDRRARIIRSLQLVGLGEGMLDRYPHEFSGGQRQRIAIARALAVEPAVIVCDEAVSALDVSTQAQIIELLLDVQQRTGVAYLFIAHDLSVVRYMSDWLVVLNRGRLVEQGPPERVYTLPAHPYTKGLVDAVPDPHPRKQRARRAMQPPPSVTTSETAPAYHAGCPYVDRCPWSFDPCDVMPTLTSITGGGEAACYLQTNGPTLDGQPLATMLPPLPRRA